MTNETNDNEMTNGGNIWKYNILMKSKIMKIAYSMEKWNW